MKVELTIPEGFHLSLEQGHGHWLAYLKQIQRNGAGQFRGGRGATPQEAIDKAHEAVLAAIKMPQSSSPLSGLSIQLDLSGFQRRT